MRKPKVEGGIVLVENQSASWSDNTHRQAQSHEIVPALILLIEDLKEQVEELKEWRRLSR